MRAIIIEILNIHIL